MDSETNPTSIPKRVERVQRARKGASSPAKLDLNLPQYFEVQSPDKEETEEWSEEQKEGAIDEEEYNSEDEMGDVVEEEHTEEKQFDMEEYLKVRETLIRAEDEEEEMGDEDMEPGEEEKEASSDRHDDDAAE